MINSLHNYCCSSRVKNGEIGQHFRSYGQLSTGSFFMKHGVYIRHVLLLEAVQFINRFFMKMFNTNNIEILSSAVSRSSVSVYQVSLWLAAPNCLGKIRQCENLFVKRRM